MSDMEQSDVVAQPDAPEHTAEELQAEIDALKAEIDAQSSQEAPPEATPVAAQQPSSASPTQQPEAEPEAVEEPISLEDAARVLLVYVKAHRTAGDSDLEAAVADVEAALSAQA